MTSLIRVSTTDQSVVHQGQSGDEVDLGSGEELGAAAPSSGPALAVTTGELDHDNRIGCIATTCQSRQAWEEHSRR